MRKTSNGSAKHPVENVALKRPAEGVAAAHATLGLMQQRIGMCPIIIGGGTRMP